MVSIPGIHGLPIRLAPVGLPQVPHHLSEQDLDSLAMLVPLLSRNLLQYLRMTTIGGPQVTPRFYVFPTVEPNGMMSVPSSGKGLGESGGESLPSSLGYRVL